MRSFKIVFAMLALMLASGICFGQESVPSDKYVTREEYNKLLKEFETLKAKIEIGETNKETPAVPKQEKKEEKQDVWDELENIKSLASSAQPGSSKFLISGYGFAGYNDQIGKKNAFDAGFNPIFLWKISDRLFFEGEPEIGLTPAGTELNLEYADASYILNDYMTIKAGKFLTPFGTFAERFHPAWINKLPDFPLALREEGGLIPFSSIGFQTSGVVPVGPTKFNYAVYAANGPGLDTGDTAAKDVGMLKFDNNNVSGSKAFGGRIGFLPIPALETGYSVYGSRVGSTEKVPAVLQAIDLGYIFDSSLIKGTADFRSQWVWSRVGHQTYDEDSALGFGPLDFNNNRNGGYLQVAYRPSKVDQKFIRNLEAVCRWDALNQPSGIPSLLDERHLTFGLNYWLGPSTVVKAAYEFENSEDPTTGKKDNAFLLQTAMGF